MTSHELIIQLASYQGPCNRFCAYCPDDFNTAEVKECVEQMQKTIYKLQAEYDALLEELVKIRAAYKQATGEDYHDD